MTDRVKCSECDNMILPQTAASNDGLCGQCVTMSEDQRRFVFPTDRVDGLEVRRTFSFLTVAKRYSLRTCVVHSLFDN
jgi:hypothetical protein